jgi:hypothetical protein
MFALILSAVFEPSIRLLHALQLLIYVAVIVLLVATMCGDSAPDA